MTVPNIILLNSARVALLKTPHTTRRVPASAFVTLLSGARMPRVGDLVLARVERLGQHRHLELACGRRAQVGGFWSASATRIPVARCARPRG